jgi:prophage antirepressor-like protein
LDIKLVTRALSNMPKDALHIMKVTDDLGREQDTNIISEKAIYRLVFKSRKKEAEEFQDWVYTMLKELRKTTGLEGFQIFRMLDKEHQKEAMSKLSNNLKNPVRIDFIKANTIANKAVSNVFGHKKMVKKDAMTPDMLVKRQEILDSTTELMAIKDKFSMDISVSEVVYSKYMN